MDYSDEIRKLLKSDEIKFNTNILLFYTLKSIYDIEFVKKSKYFSKSLLNFFAKLDVPLLDTSMFDQSQIVQENKYDNVFDESTILEIDNVALRRNSIKSIRDQSYYNNNEFTMDHNSIIRSDPSVIIKKIIEYEQEYILDREDNDYIILYLVKNYIFSEEDPKTSALMTSYNLFASSIELIFCLKLVQSFPLLSCNPREKVFFDQYLENTNSRVLLFFKNWASIYKHKYENNKLIQSLIKSHITQEEPILELGSITMSEPILPLRILTINKILNEGIFSFHFNEIAKQLSLIDHYLLSNLTIQDFINFLKGIEEPESFKKIFEREKQIKSYIWAFILAQDTLEDKKNAIQNFIQLSHACRQQSNFQAAYTILKCLMTVNITKRKHLFIEKKFREIYVSLEKEFHEIELQEFKYTDENKKNFLPIIPNLRIFINHMDYLISIKNKNEITDQIKLAKLFKEFNISFCDIIRKKLPYFRISPLFEFLEFGILEYLRPKTWNLKFKGELNYLEDYNDLDKILEFLYDKFKKIDN